MNETNQQLANETEAAVRALNDKFREAERAGLHVVAKVNEFIGLNDTKTDKRTRIEAALSQRITPNTNNGANR